MPVVRATDHYRCAHSTRSVRADTAIACAIGGLDMKLRVTIEMELSEEKIRERFTDLAAVEYLHVLKGGDLHPGKHPSLTRDYYLEKLAWDTILGDRNHGADLASSFTTTIEELTPPQIVCGAKDEFCPVCRHYPGSHTVNGCHDVNTVDLGMTPSARDGVLMHTSTCELCPCKEKGTLVLRHDSRA
jgi:hypothetical protein